MGWRVFCETRGVGMKDWTFEDGLEKESAWTGYAGASYREV